MGNEKGEQQDHNLVLISRLEALGGRGGGGAKMGLSLSLALYIPETVGENILTREWVGGWLSLYCLLADSGGAMKRI